MKAFKDYNRVLIIGAGSGRDIASAILITERFNKPGINIDLAGFLTPWALHTFKNRFEGPINIIQGESKKFLANDTNKALDSYFEHLLPVLNREYNLGISNIYLFSLHYGLSALQKEVEKLIEQNHYDLIIAVDVGGDALARKKDLKTIFTPIVDLSCVQMLSRIRCNSDKALAVVSPGVDGEISCERIGAILNEFNDQRKVLRVDDFNMDSVEYIKMKAVTSYIESHTLSTSGTNKIIERMLRNGGKNNFANTYSKNYKIENKNWQIDFDVTIPKNFYDKIFYLDLDSVADSDLPRLEYESVFEAQLQLRPLTNGTEVDMYFIPVKLNDNGFKKIIYSLTPMEKMKDEIRSEIISYGVHTFLRGELGCALLILQNDFNTVFTKNKNQLSVEKVGEFCILTK